jgi:hypothetical protein
MLKKVINKSENKRKRDRDHLVDSEVVSFNAGGCYEVLFLICSITVLFLLYLYL